MKAVLTTAPGGLERTSLADVDEPVAEKEDIVIAIRAVGLNPADRFLIDRHYPGGPSPPFIAGRDAAGVVVQADATGRWPVGTKVLVVQSSATNLAQGSLAQKQRFPAGSVDMVPSGWNWAEAATALVYQTAWKALTRHGEITAGHVVAVTGAGGGVGIATVQLALSLGAKVVALSRSPEKQERLKDLGAHYVFSSNRSDLKSQVLAAVGKKGVDVVVDTVGGPFLSMAVHLLVPAGKVSVVGVLGGVEGSVPIPALMFKQASIQGILVTDRPPTQSVAEWRQAVDVLNKGNHRPVIDRCFPLTDYQAGFFRLGNNPFGKVIIEIA